MPRLFVLSNLLPYLVGLSSSMVLAALPIPGQSKEAAKDNTSLTCSDTVKPTKLGQFEALLPIHIWPKGKKGHMREAHNEMLYARITPKLKTSTQNMQNLPLEEWQHRFLITYRGKFEQNTNEARRLHAARASLLCPKDRFIEHIVTRGSPASKDDQVSMTICASPKDAPTTPGTLTLTRFHILDGALFELSLAWKKPNIIRTDLSTWPVNTATANRAVTCLQAIAIRKQASELGE